MSLQTSIVNYFKIKSNLEPVQSKKMENKNKSKRRSLSLNKSAPPNKSPKKLNHKSAVDEIIDISSSSEDILSSLEALDSTILANSPSPSLNKSLNATNTSLDSSSTVVSPFKESQQTPKTPTKTSQSPRSGKKFFSPTKKRMVPNRTPTKRRLDTQFKENSVQQEVGYKENDVKPVFKFSDDKTLFLHSTIDKFLKTESLKHLLDEGTQQILSRCMDITEPGLRVICRLYWRLPGWYRSDQLQQIANEKTKISSPDMYLMLTSLLEKNLIVAAQNEGESTLDFDECVKILKKPELQQICKELKLKMQKKQDAVDELRRFSRCSSISNHFTGQKGNNSTRVLKMLRLKVGNCYRLSDVARKSLYELYLLMYLGIDYSIMRDKKLELMLLNDKANKETYPIDKNTVVDNASVVFSTKDNFYSYLDAHLMYERYLESTDTKEKCDIVLHTLKLFKKLSKDLFFVIDELTSEWLERYTPSCVYVYILENGVQELKKAKSKEQYELAIEILDTLIRQRSFRQHKMAEWYAEKALILHKHLNNAEQAAETLLRGFKEDMSEELKDALRPRANKLADMLDDKLACELRTHVKDSLVLERDMPADHVYKLPMDNYNQRGKLKFEAFIDGKRTTLSAEDYCILHYTQNGEFTRGDHAEGRLVITLYHLLFWDIIYSSTEDMRGSGLFLTHYQRHPLDMYCRSFYMNRREAIDDRLQLIEDSTDAEIVAMMKTVWDERPEYELSGISRNVEFPELAGLATCIGARALSAICRRLALNYGYSHSGFPDLTLWNVNTKQVKFVEVKTDADKPSMKQLQWLRYLRQHGVSAGFCYVGANTTRCRARTRVSSL
ncbi:fanconi-associated nuclease 1-like [Anticarsia gemmatalis]|uniref:fanconi-associated nuclease 1-like n=1 Tax=Anticarsia gemmatalis TaxID=129554 RepID=UPI003F77382C